MEFTRRYLPMEWEERWRKEKERRKRVIEEGGEGLEQDNRELRQIVAYNDSRMGLASQGDKTDEHEGRKTQTTAGAGGGCIGDEAFGDLGCHVHTYSSRTFAEDIFMALKGLQNSSLLTDLTLTTEDGGSFSVHSLVLAAVSVFISDRLKERNMAQSYNTQGEVHMWSLHMGAKVDQVGLQAVVQFAYSGTVSILNKDMMTQIRTAAQVLEVIRLLDLCSNKVTKKEDKCSKTEEGTISAEVHLLKTLESIKGLWGGKVGCDVILDVDGICFHVHRIILAISSDYFRGMFTCGMRESYQTRISLPFIPAGELEALIHWSYNGTLPLSWDSVFEITCTALQLQFQPAYLLCLRFMREEMHINSCLDVASFAEAYGLSELLEEANDFVLKNFREVSATAKFQDLSAQKLLDLLRCDGLCVPSELTVFRAVITWIQADPEERMAQAALLMSGVRFPLMTFREFREVRAVNLRMECFADKEVELYGSALQEFGFSQPKLEDYCRIRRPKDVLAVVGGDKLDPDVGKRLPSQDIWFANSLRNGTGLVKAIEWRRLGEIPDKPKFRHGVAVMNGRLFVAGGCYFYAKDDIMKSVYSYNPVKNRWKGLADMQESRSNFSLVVHKKCLYAIGGDTEINTNTESVEMYKPDTDSWSYVHPLDQALSGYGVSAMNGGIFISGGFNCKYVCLVSMFLYHPERGSVYLADMSHDRAQHCMEALRGRLYVAGGVCNMRKFYTDQLACEVYDPASDSWADLIPLPVPHVGAASAVLEEKIYVLGGYCQDDYSESGLVHRFDPGLQRWENMGKLPGAVTDIKACLLHLPQHFRH
ncbi:kelch-like protein 33 isoform X1 [Fundulus heteroclitus]|uniref:kelch-like protein 33 isoform X1 n=1 Tax=Fundulus heteroclitus TaxID=8078 RepID=UPI00165B7D09|nr:kelch-like protein 33 isoform X1 [Fundulus heteroclitus]